MKRAATDIAQALGLWAASVFSVAFMLGFIEGAANLQPPGILYENWGLVTLFSLLCWLVAMIQCSLWRERRAHADEPSELEQ